MKYVKVIDSQAADQGILSGFREKCTNIKDSDELNGKQQKIHLNYSELVVNQYSDGCINGKVTIIVFFNIVEVNKL